MSISLWSLLLGQEGLNRARRLFENLHNNPDEAFADLKFEEAHQLRNLLPSISSYYSLELTRINPAYFSYLSDKQREELINKLLFMFYVFALEYKIHLTEDRKAKRIELEAKLKQCSELLYQLGESAKPLTPENQLNREINHAEKCLHLLGYTIVAPYIIEKALAFIDAKYQEAKQADIDVNTAKINEILTDINDARLYWVWAGGLLASIFQAISDTFYGNAKAKQQLNKIAPYTGYMSFILYYIRFAVNILLLLKHTIKGFWMSTAEKEIELPTWEKFKTQWQQRKFALLNDLIWGLANMACYLWLKGEGKLGYIGSIVCALLLLMDLTLSIWRYKEEKKEYDEKIIALEEAQRQLKKLKTNLKEELKALIDDDKKREALLRELREIDYKIAENSKLQKDIQFNWQYSRYQHINNIAYSASLFSGFAVMSGFLIPTHLLAQSMLLTTGIVGAALCFTLTTIYAAVTYAIEVHKLTESKRLIDEEKKLLTREFKKLQGNDEDTENQRKQLFLRIRGLELEAEYTRRLILFQNLKLAKSIISNVLIPTLVFIGLVFMPFGIGAAVIAASVFLILLTNVLVNRQKPEAPKLVTFNKDAYEKFRHKQDNLAAAGNEPKTKISRYRLFNSDGIKQKTVESAESAAEEAESLLHGTEATSGAISVCG
ncbi:hypothetical protein ACQUW5_09025 [Legionella sp. CNM-1927-20]|uniref:hypothetical protein n=1 Tax=Legionella sp. CNM-1927-20 TaxID=3422221 RepID=UPI00403AC47E